LDLICGLAIDHLAINPNVYYHAQNRFIDGDQGGTQCCSTTTICGTSFCDSSFDGCKQWNESCLSNCIITCSGHDYTGATVCVTAKCDSYGNFKFTNLNACDKDGYKITACDKDGFVFECVASGSNGGASCDHGKTMFVNCNSNCSGNDVAY